MDVPLGLKASPGVSKLCIFSLCLFSFNYFPTIVLLLASQSGNIQLRLA